MSENLTFKYAKSYFFPVFGIVSIALASLLTTPFAMCKYCWNWQWFMHWPFLYIFPIVMAYVLLLFGLSNLSFWFFHVRKKLYMTITDDMLLIDAETDIKIADIVSVAPCGMLGCEMLCLEIKNPQDYKFSWRFRADKIFHKKYDAFVCPGLVSPEQRAAFLEWFENRFPKSEA